MNTFGYAIVGVTHDSGNTWLGSHLLCGTAHLQGGVMDLSIQETQPQRLWAGVNVGAILAVNGAETEGRWECSPGDDYPALRGAAVVGFAELQGVLYAAPVKITGPSVGGAPETTTMPAIYRLRQGAAAWETLPAPSGASGATTMTVDQANRRLLIGTRTGLWAFIPPPLS